MSTGIESAAPIINIIMIVGSIILGTGVIVTLAIFFLYLSKFKHKVTLWRVVGGKVDEFHDRAKEKKVGEITYLKLLKKKREFQMPTSDYFTRMTKGLKLYIRWDGINEFQPQKIEFNSPLIMTPAKYNVMSQYSRQVRDSKERYANAQKWKELLPFLAWGLFVVLTAVTLWILFKELGGLTGSIDNMAASIKTLEAGQVVS